MAEDVAFFNMPMYFDGKKTITAQPSDAALIRQAKNLTIATSSGSSRDSISSKSIGSSYSSRSSNIAPTSASDLAKSSTMSPVSDFRDANTVNFTPISTQDAMIFAYGYRGNSDPLSIPGGFETISWDSEKIEETVTPKFLKDRIPSKHGKKRLDVPLGFGDGLTDETYAEWVVQKSKRLFLLLLEFGIPEKIFDVVDQSWDDDDLPLEPHNISRLKLRDYYDKSLEAKFYKRQFSYILKEFSFRCHIDFQEQDEIPLVVAYRQKNPGFSFASDDRVHRPRRPEVHMYRRKVILGLEPDGMMESDFLAEVEILRNLSHPHIVDLQASYTYLYEACILTTPACDYSLKSFIQSPSNTFKALSKEQRRKKIISWIHCLNDALAYLHDEGVKDLDIRPRTILVNDDNIYFSDIAIMTGLDNNMGSIEHVEAERYEYGAPENWTRVLRETQTAPSTPVVSNRARSFLRTFSMASSNPMPSAEGQDDNASEHSDQSARSSQAVSDQQFPTPVQIGEWVSNVSKPFKASTFSLACIMLDLLTFHAKKKASAFLSHRTTKKGSSRGGGKPDPSFHANLGQVASWVEILDKEASKKGGEDRAIRNMLQICQSMMYREPDIRPTQPEIADMLWNIIREDGGRPHCGTLEKHPTKEEWEEAALARGDVEWEWPWDDKRSTRNRSLTGRSSKEYC